MLDQRQRRRVLGRMRVFLVGEAEDAEERLRPAGEDLAVQEAQDPVAPVPAVAQEGIDHAGIAPGLPGEPHHGRKIAFEIAAGETQTRAQISEGADPAVELQRRRDLAPVGADPLRELGQRVGDAH